MQGTARSRAPRRGGSRRQLAAAELTELQTAEAAAICRRARLVSFLARTSYDVPTRLYVISSAPREKRVPDTG